jgi:hypothetical protein
MGPLVEVLFASHKTLRPGSVQAQSQAQFFNLSPGQTVWRLERLDITRFSRRPPFLPACRIGREIAPGLSGNARVGSEEMLAQETGSGKRGGREGRGAFVFP